MCGRASRVVVPLSAGPPPRRPPAHRLRPFSPRWWRATVLFVRGLGGLIGALPGLRWVLGDLPSFLGGAPSHLGGARSSEGGGPGVLLGARGFLLGWQSSKLGGCTSVGRQRALELGVCLKLLGSCPEKTGAWVKELG